MSQVLLYHYHEGKAEPIRNVVGNANDWMAGLQQLIGISIKKRFDYTGQKYIDAYNKFQDNDHPEWQKIAACFLTDFTLVLDDDRKKVAEALKKAYEHVKDKVVPDGTIENSIYRTGDEILSLEEGPIVVTTSFAEWEEPFCKRKVNIKNFMTALQEYQGNPRAEEIEDLIAEHEFMEVASVDTALTIFKRAIPAPRRW